MGEDRCLCPGDRGFVLGATEHVEQETDLNNLFTGMIEGGRGAQLVAVAATDLLVGEIAVFFEFSNDPRFERSVIPAIAARSLTRLSGFCEIKISTLAWLVRNVHGGRSLSVIAFSISAIRHAPWRS
ncbi:MAG: hypothetical protein U9N78_03355 [Actinomycetota bacterium]|nr:hypothetical protein [Actinomycetota bacterium]